MEILKKIQSTKLGLVGAAVAVLGQTDASPWCIVAVVVGYCVTDAVQKVLGK